MADFTGPILTLAWLAKFELPDATLRFCDGGLVIWDEETFQSTDETFGTLGIADAAEEAIGDQAPSLNVLLLPKDTAAAVEISQPEMQGSRARFWLAKVDRTTGEVDGAPELVADLEIDTTRLNVGRLRTLELGLISIAERLFAINEGAVLSPRFHKSMWPGELGLDNATGVPLAVAWGVTAPPRGSVAGGSGAGGGSGGPREVGGPIRDL